MAKGGESNLIDLCTRSIYRSETPEQQCIALTLIMGFNTCLTDARKALNVGVKVVWNCTHFFCKRLQQD